MLEILKLLAGTVALRPYVFVFFACYLFLAVTTIGRKRTLLFTVTAYLIAFACEWSSVHNGFPFGLYHYIQTTADRELWIAGVPFMDSLSFTFLSYVSYETALILRSPPLVRFPDVQILGTKRLRSSWGTILLAAFLMMYLDIVIDPVALQGERWFLGKIYYYPDGGSYFGVTIANFIGWFCVCVFILGIFTFLEKRLKSAPTDGVIHYPLKGLAPAGLYFGVLGFNLTMTFLIGEKTMGWASLFITSALAVILVNHVSHAGLMRLESTVAEYGRDYPNSPLEKAYPDIFSK